MNDKEYYRIVSSVFLLVAIAHAIRAFYGWDAEIAGVMIPVWFSWVAVVLLGYLSFRGFSRLSTYYPARSKSKKK